MKTFTALLLALLANGCSMPPPTMRAGTSELAAPPRRGALDVEMQAPARAVWIASTLGPTKPTLRIVVTNGTADTADVSDLRVHLEAEREDTSFRCADSGGPDSLRREPSSLSPGASFTFERAVDCSLPLTGHYTVRVSVSFGSGAWRAPHAMRTFDLAVTSSGRDEPRPIAPIPGLWAALGASPLISGVDAREGHAGDKTGAGHGRIAVLLVNSGTASLALPPLRLALRVYRAGTSIPCEGDPTTIRAPAVLGSGASHRQAIEVSCLGLHAPGLYEVVGRLVTPDGEVDIGRLRVAISNDPSLLAPSTRAGSWSGP